MWKKFFADESLLAARPEFQDVIFLRKSTIGRVNMQNTVLVWLWMVLQMSKFEVLKQQIASVYYRLSNEN